MSQTASSRHGHVTLNTDGRPHPLQNALAAFAAVCGLISVVSAWYPSTHLVGSWAGLVGLLGSRLLGVRFADLVDASDRRAAVNAIEQVIACGDAGTMLVQLISRSGAPVRVNVGWLQRKGSGSTSNGSVAGVMTGSIRALTLAVPTPSSALASSVTSTASSWASSCARIRTSIGSSRLASVRPLPNSTACSLL